MNTSSRVPLQVAHNEDLWQPLVLVGDDGAALNLTGATLKMDVRHETTDALLLSCTVVNGRLIVTDAAAGALEILIIAADLAPIPAGTYAYDILLTANARTRRLCWGPLKIGRGITQ